jgi:hypothetical protein
MPVYGGAGVNLNARGQASQYYALQAGECMLIPAGAWWMSSKYSSVQVLDPVSGEWTWAGDAGQSMRRIESDGVNFRIANQTGCAIGSVITNAGTLYTSAPTVTASSGASIWQAIVGGAISTSVTVTAGGSGYVYPPLVQISAPPSPGRQAAAICTLSGGAVSTVTVSDQGAGYTSAPTITFQNDPREGLNSLSTGSNAAATATLTGAGTITGLILLDHGTPLTAVPTLAFSGGGGSAAAATVLMDFTITGYSVTTAGAAYTTLAVAGAVEISGVGGFVTTTPAYTNSDFERARLRRRRASILAPTTTGGGITATGAIVDDGGHYEAIPTVIIGGNTAIITTPALVVPAVGGVTDVIALFPA